MQLSLKIVSYHRLTPGQQGIFQAERDSFTIGRSEENHWCIPDPQRFLSGVHCRIHREGDFYYITDTSKNGVFLNGSSKRLELNETVALKHGDKFRIGDYEIEVLIEADTISAARSSDESENIVETDPFDQPFTDSSSQISQPDDDSEFQKEINTPLAHIDERPTGNVASIESLMDLDDLDEKQDDQPSAESLREKQSPLRKAFTPSSHASHDSHPEVQTDFDEEIPDNWDEATGMLEISPQTPEPSACNSSEIPNDWDEATGVLKSPQAGQALETGPAQATVGPEPGEQRQPRPKPLSRPPSPTSTIPGGDTLIAFTRGAGLQPGDLEGIDHAVLFEQIGNMMREFTDGLVQTLSGRTHIKSEFRLDQTMIRPVENNPLKFSTSKTGTLRQLLTNKDPAYLAGVDAIRESFDDINAHQIAVVAGMEAALQDILNRFNPKVLETRLDSDSILDNILPGGKKAKYWEIFKLLFDQIAGEAEDDFQQLFGNKFSVAYEKQLGRLKNTHEE